MRRTLFTIGHSTHALPRFLALLAEHGVTALYDVRSQPYSRRNPQFNREALRQALLESGMNYVFLGRELGARSEDPSCYLDGKVQYDRLARTELFQQGLNRVRAGMQRERIALMCAEKEPLACHRTILVARHLHAAGTGIGHILADGSLETHEQTLSRLLQQLKLPEQDMLRSREEVISDAYQIQGERIAYAGGKPGPETASMEKIRE